MNPPPSSFAAPRERRPFGGGNFALVVIAGGAVALGIGLAVGDPTPGNLTMAAAVVGLLVMITAFARPFAGLLVLAASSILLIAVGVTATRSANAFDVLLIPTIVGTLWTMQPGARRRPPDDPIAHAARRLSGATRVFYGLAALSLVPLALRGEGRGAIDSGLVLVRGIMGLALFPLFVHWLDRDRRIHLTLNAMLFGAVGFTVVNALAVVLIHVKRAGLNWTVNYPQAPISGPNEGATAMLMIWVLLLVKQGMRPRLHQVVLMVAAIAMLVMTQSRSGLLAWITFTVLTMGSVRKRWLVIGLLLALSAVPLIPADYWTRLTRTLVLQKGTFEAYSSLVRVYGWHVAWRVFLDHPIFGVGYLGYRLISAQYNELRVVLITTENYFLEIATGMGLIGLSGLAIVLVRLFQLGAAVRANTAPGTFAHRLATYHGPFLVALLVANLTADNFVGMMGLAQIALWSALLVRVGQLDRTPGAPA